MKLLERFSEERIGNWLYRELMLKKFVSPLGLLILVSLALFTGFMAANDLLFVPLALAAILIGVVMVYQCLLHPHNGLYIVSVFGILVFYPNHLLGRDLLPLSPVWEILVLITFLGSYLKPSVRLGHSGRLLKTPISLILLVYTMYVLLQGFNPNVPNVDGWLPAVRRFMIYILLYVTTYRLVITRERMRFFVRFWIISFFIVGLYGCFQQWFGYLPMELNYIMSTPGSFELLFQGGQLRKFSFLSDPATFGIQAASMAVFTAVIALNTKNKKRKYTYFFFALIMLLGMAYSGTRTSNIIPPLGLALYGMMTIQNRTTVITIFIGTMMGMFLLFAPIYTSPTLNRMRTTFDKKDESLNLRERNRHYIQPYLHAHPIGGGIGTTNALGAQLYPDHPLADFPTDSGLLRIGLEMGWIGLALWVFFNLLLMWQGIIYYFKIRDPEYKMYMVAMLCAIFPVIVSQYSQDSVGQFPGIIFMFSSMALFKRMLEFDEESQAKLRNII